MLPMNPIPEGGLRALALAALLALPASAQGARLQIQGLEKLAAQANEVVDVTLEGPSLRMATRFLEKDPEGKALVQGLKGVYVRSFTFAKGESYPREEVEALRAQLKGPGWSRIVGVVDKKAKENVEVYVMADAAGNPQGLAVVAAEPQELTVVNIVGAIDLDRLGSLEGKFGIPSLQGKEGKAKKGAGHAPKP